MRTGLNDTRNVATILYNQANVEIFRYRINVKLREERVSDSELKDAGDASESGPTNEAKERDDEVEGTE